MHIIIKYKFAFIGPPQGALATGARVYGQKNIFVDLDKSYKPIFSESKNINQKPRYRDLKFGSTIEIHRASKLKMVISRPPLK